MSKTTWVFCGAVLFIVLVVTFVPIKDAIFGVPMVVKKAPNALGRDGFVTRVKVPCNRFYEREIGFRIDPPIAVSSVQSASSAVKGEVKLTVQQGRAVREEVIDLAKTGWNLNAEGIWSKTITRYAPLGSFFCGKQNIIIEARRLSFDPYEHEVTVYVSRDRRP